MTKTHEYQASCFCGAVRFTLDGAPEAMAYCHCSSCRRWSAGPVNAFTLWRPEALRITEGEQALAAFEGNPGSAHTGVVSRRTWCTRCGGHVFVEHPAMGLIDVPAVLIEGLDFKPGFHVHYQESVHPMDDGLDKFKDLPLEAGGSGERLSSAG